MSKVGKLPIEFDNTIKINVNGQTLSVSGKNGELVWTFAPEVILQKQENSISVIPIDKTQRSRAMWGLSQRLISNMVKGVTEGFVEKLEINGVGYKAEVNDGNLFLSLGYSHIIIVKIPESIKVICEKPTLISISGSNKQEVGQFAADVRSYRKPEPYKGKGIRYSNEKVRRKEGKKK